MPLWLPSAEHPVQSCASVTAAAVDSAVKPLTAADEPRPLLLLLLMQPPLLLLLPLMQSSLLLLPLTILCA